MPAVGLQGNPNVVESQQGHGFGYYGAYFFEEGGKEYEVLLGHFKDLPYKGQKDGDVIPLEHYWDIKEHLEIQTLVYMVDLHIHISHFMSMVSDLRRVMKYWLILQRVCVDQLVL